MRRRAVTLIEVLVVIGILLIVTAIVLPVYSSAKVSAWKVATASNLRQLAMAQQMYAADNGEKFALQSGLRYNWIRQLEPYIGEVPRAPHHKPSRLILQHPGYVVNDCLRFGSHVLEDPSSVVLFTESAEFQVSADHYVVVLRASKPDEYAYQDKLLQNPGIRPIGKLRSRYYHGGNFYVRTDGSAIFAVPEAVYDQPHDCVTEKSDLKTYFPLRK